MATSVGHRSLLDVPGEGAVVRPLELGAIGVFADEGDHFRAPTDVGDTAPPRCFLDALLRVRARRFVAVRVGPAEVVLDEYYHVLDELIAEDEVLGFGVVQVVQRYERCGDSAQLLVHFYSHVSTRRYTVPMYGTELSVIIAHKYDYVNEQASISSLLTGMQYQVKISKYKVL